MYLYLCLAVCVCIIHRWQGANSTGMIGVVVKKKGFSPWQTQHSRLAGCPSSILVKKRHVRAHQGGYQPTVDSGVEIPFAPTPAEMSCHCRTSVPARTHEPPVGHSRSSLCWYVWLHQGSKSLTSAHITFQSEEKPLDIVGEFEAVGLPDYDKHGAATRAHAVSELLTTGSGSMQQSLSSPPAGHLSTLRGTRGSSSLAHPDSSIIRRDVTPIQAT